MIKKTTKVIFTDNSQENSELIGGMPLSKDEIVHVHKNAEIIDYIVADKIIDYFDKGDDQEVNITYTLKKK